MLRAVQSFADLLVQPCKSVDVEQDVNEWDSRMKAVAARALMFSASFAVTGAGVYGLFKFSDQRSFGFFTAFGLANMAFYGPGVVEKIKEINIYLFNKNDDN